MALTPARVAASPPQAHRSSRPPARRCARLPPPGSTPASTPAMSPPLTTSSTATRAPATRIPARRQNLRRWTPATKPSWSPSSWRASSPTPPTTTAWSPITGTPNRPPSARTKPSPRLPPMSRSPTAASLARPAPIAPGSRSTRQILAATRSSTRASSPMGETAPSMRSLAARLSQRAATCKPRSSPNAHQRAGRRRGSSPTASWRRRTSGFRRAVATISQPSSRRTSPRQKLGPSVSGRWVQTPQRRSSTVAPSRTGHVS